MGALCLSAAALASTPTPVVCAGGTSLATFQLLVRPFSPGAPLSLKSVAEIHGGSVLIWSPSHLFPMPSHNAEIAAVLVPAHESDVILTLEPRKAETRTEWQLPERPQVIALIYGPQGLSEGKINSLVTHNRELLKQLADYAEQSSQVEALIQDLSNAEQAGAHPDAVFQGISARYGVTPQKLSTAQGSDNQAALLLKAVLPSVSAYDPLAAQNSQVQQSGGLAASVAGLFFGNPVALAAGGAALFSNLKTVMFPNTEFRSAFAQSAEKDALMFCTKNPAPKAKTRIAYLWAYRVPEIHKPVLTFVGTPYLPLAAKSPLPVKIADGFAAKDLALARDWRVTPVAGGLSIPVTIQQTPAGALELDLSKAKANAGEYRLSTTWDWSELTVAGTLHLHPFDDFTHVMLPPEERDKLIAGNSDGDGDVSVALAGADFEFLEKVQIESSARGAKLADVDFHLPLGKRAGPQSSVILRLDTEKPGAYKLLLAQADGVSHTVPVAVLPPNPHLTNLPIRLNVRETRAPIHLAGTGLDRIESVSSDAVQPGSRQVNRSARFAHIQADWEIGQVRIGRQNGDGHGVGNTVGLREKKLVGAWLFSIQSQDHGTLWTGPLPQREMKVDVRELGTARGRFDLHFFEELEIGAGERYGNIAIAVAIAGDQLVALLGREHHVREIVEGMEVKGTGDRQLAPVPSGGQAILAGIGFGLREVELERASGRLLDGYGDAQAACDWCDAPVSRQCQIFGCKSVGDLDGKRRLRGERQVRRSHEREDGLVNLGNAIGPQVGDTGLSFGSGIFRAEHQRVLLSALREEIGRAHV